MKDGIGADKSAVVAESLLHSVTNGSDELMPGDVNVAVDLLEAIVNVSVADVNTSIVRMGRWSQGKALCAIRLHKLMQ